ncbi:MAG: 25S rRNA (adenine645-N1)-methyltransferase [Bathelium mastoideum]|nr:MAG: 25S rRNA (adenine645-N1)-methyltransferase [Bathelium mastoideum]
MFAVPGWSVNATNLKQQTEPPNDSNESKKSKKRKREGNAPTVTPENVGKLWEQTFEKKDPGRKKSKRDKRRLKQEANKEQQDEDAAVQNPTVQPKTVANGAPKTNSSSAPELKPQQKRHERTQLGSNNNSATPQAASHASHPQASIHAPLPPANKLTPLQNSMRQKLTSARFRHLNESLYTQPSSESLALFSESPEMFEEYHKGFRQQVAVWPENPVDTFLRIIQERGKSGTTGSNQQARSKQPARKPHQSSPPTATTTPPLPRTKSLCTIADLGCGDAALASALQPSLSALRLRIHSFDLHATNPLVTRADIAALPLADGSIDVAITCLALMGTNWLEFLDEAWRVLRWRGELWVAEIKSRFGRVSKRQGDKRAKDKKDGARMGKREEAEEGKRREEEEEKELAIEVDGAAKPAETDVGGFVELLRRRGFALKEGEGAIDFSNKMFVRMEFVKSGTPVKGKNMPKDGGGSPEESNGTTWKKRTKAKFLEDKEEIEDAEEAKVLKPCVYKLR